MRGSAAAGQQLRADDEGEQEPEEDSDAGVEDERDLDEAGKGRPRIRTATDRSRMTARHVVSPSIVAPVRDRHHGAPSP